MTGRAVTGQPVTVRAVTTAAVAVVGAVAARRALAGVVRAVPPQRLARTNYRGRQVSLAGGPALAIGASTAAALGAVLPPAGGPRLAGAALVAGLGAGAVGAYDDAVGDRPEHKAKGFAGHLAALRHARVTSGLVKIVGVGASGLAAAALIEAGAGGRRHPALRAADVLLGGALIAGTANLVNLLDLRPGRATKASLLIGAPVALTAGAGAGMAAGALGAAAGLLPADLDEQIMLGDAGANALGALLGTALAARTGPLGRALLVAGVAALTATSERVSFTRVIDRTPVLRELDRLGRRAD